MYKLWVMAQALIHSHFSCCTTPVIQYINWWSEWSYMYKSTDIVKSIIYINIKAIKMLLCSKSLCFCSIITYSVSLEAVCPYRLWWLLLSANRKTARCLRLLIITLFVQPSTAKSDVKITVWDTGSRTMWERSALLSHQL